MTVLVVLDSLPSALSSGDLRALSVAASTDESLVVLSLLGSDDGFETRIATYGAPRLLVPGSPIDRLDSLRVSALIEKCLSTVDDVGLVLGGPSIGLRDAFGRLTIRSDGELVTGVTLIRRDDDGTIKARTALDGDRKAADISVDAETLVYGLVDPSPPDDPHCGHGGETAPVRVGLVIAEIDSPVRIVEREPLPDLSAAPLQSAEIVVAGGRGMGTAASLRRLEEWANESGFAFGSSRAPVESSWVAYDRLIGQTGTTVAPRLYIAFGISGAPQHMSGVRNANRIVAINTDPRSPIAEESDVLIVADALEILEELLRQER